MLSKSKFWFFLSLFFLSTTAFSAEVTEGTVKKLLSEMDVAITNLDSETLAKTLSDDIQITIHINIQGNEQVMKPSKQDYISMLKQGWAAVENYSYKRSDLVIDIKDGKAVVSANVKETMTVQGQSLSGESKEVATVESVNGKLLFTNIVGHTSL